MLSSRRLLGYTLLSCLLAFAVLLAACSPQANPPNQVLIVETSAGRISLDPASLNVFGDSISANLYFHFNEPLDGGITDYILDATFIVPKRLLQVNKALYYDRRDRAVMVGRLTGYSYIESGSSSDELMQKLISYCQSQGRTVDTEPLPFLKQGFQYTQHVENVMRFFDPASVKLSDGTLEFIMLDFHYMSGLYYTHSVTVDTSQHRLLIHPGKRHDGTGRIIGAAEGSEWMEYIPQKAFGKVVDIILQSYYHGQ